MGQLTWPSGRTRLHRGWLPAGRYRVRVPNSPAGWMFKAAMLNGVDVSETPFDLTRDVTDLVLSFTDRWSGMAAPCGARAATARWSSRSRPTRRRGRPGPSAAAEERARQRERAVRPRARCRPATTTSSRCRRSRRATGGIPRRSRRSRGSRPRSRSPKGSTRRSICACRRSASDRAAARGDLIAQAQTPPRDARPPAALATATISGVVVSDAPSRGRCAARG